MKVLRWEYRIEYFTKSEELDELGDLGWELVSAHTSSTYVNRLVVIRCIFKRPFGEREIIDSPARRRQVR